MTDRIALVTGATGAIGEAIARGIAEHDGFEVVLACRNGSKAARARDAIARATGNERVRVELVDVSRPGSVAELAERWQGPLHVLVNNAADTPRQRTETPEGIETQLATNVLGYFRMTLALESALRADAPSRVVNVASYWAGGLDLDDLQFTRRPYDNDAAYRQSKQANRMLTVAFARRFEPHGVAVNACHPGDVNSTLSNSLGFGGHQSPEDGADTPVWLATDDTGQRETGAYFERRSRSRCAFGADAEAVEALYRACVELSPS